ncbi:hypothetical protein DFH09DRAFT_1084458 [Mycena vulgaris]|nr:hypothetical protein DFH09DRAFT_1084458 [Mycena vulgaris]
MGKQATSAPCHQIDRNGPGVLPPAVSRSLPRTWKRDAAQRRPRGLSAVLDRQQLDDGAARACAGRKASERGEAAAREAHPPQQPPYSRADRVRGDGLARRRLYPEKCHADPGKGGGTSRRKRTRGNNGDEGVLKREIRGASAAARKAGEGRNGGKAWESEDEARHGEHATGEEGVQAENDWDACEAVRDEQKPGGEEEGGMDGMPRIGSAHGGKRHPRADPDTQPTLGGHPAQGRARRDLGARGFTPMSDTGATAAVVVEDEYDVEVMQSVFAADEASMRSEGWISAAGGVRGGAAERERMCPSACLTRERTHRL